MRAPGSAVKIDTESHPMCAMFRDRKPADENRYNTEAKPRGFVEDARFQPPELWEIGGRLQTGRAWIMR